MVASGKPVARRGKEPGAVTGRTRTQPPTSNNGNAAKHASSVGSAPPLDFSNKSTSFESVQAALAVASCAAEAAFVAAAASAAVASIPISCPAVKAAEA